MSKKNGKRKNIQLIMSDTLKSILEEFESLKGQLVISGYDRIYRLVGVGDDGEDFYWILWKGDENLEWHSCVGRIMPLKGYLRDVDYEELVRIAKLNHWDFMCGDLTEREAIKEELSKLSPDHKVVSGLIWELN